MKRTFLVWSVILCLVYGPARADVTLPAIISDHMVLKKDARVPIWGRGAPGEEVIVSMNGQSAKANASPDGRWRILLNLADSGPGPFQMTVQGKNTITINDVVVGAVWVAAGQSNMEWPIRRSKDAQAEIASSLNPMLRQFEVTKCASPEPKEDCQGRWVTASPGTTGAFSAVGYYFGKALQSDLGIPVGLIHSSWGGTSSESWTSTAALDAVKEFKTAKNEIHSFVKGHPEKQRQWAIDFTEWLKTNHREDSSGRDKNQFASPDTPISDWQPVKIPGPVQTGKISGRGVVWIRTEIDIAQPGSNLLPLDLGAMEGFESVYCNGAPIVSLDYRNYQGAGYIRRLGKYNIPANKLRPGKNVIAIRIYAPSDEASFPTSITIGDKIPNAGWTAAEEYSLPVLTASQRSSIPKPPEAPPPPQSVASFLFNGMIRPIIPYAISGVIWYQGESNAERAFQYRTAFPLLVEDWRRSWQQGEFPFYFCQLPNYLAKKPAPGESAWAELREAQSMALSLPATGQAVLIDLGDSRDVHPVDKREVGRRLSLIALAKDYGRKIPFSGPVFQSVTFESGKARVRFFHADGGLKATPVPATYSVSSRDNETAPMVRNNPNSELEGFAICGEDKKWVWANAKVEGDSVIVWSDKVAAPIAVRYGWADNPTVNLSNGSGLPASPFRTDDFPVTTQNARYTGR